VLNSHFERKKRARPLLFIEISAPAAIRSGEGSKNVVLFSSSAVLLLYMHAHTHICSLPRQILRLVNETDKSKEKREEEENNAGKKKRKMLSQSDFPFSNEKCSFPSAASNEN